MSGFSIIIIARSGDTPALRKLLGDGVVEVFPDSESLRAWDAIAARPPKMLVLDPLFVATARGAALVAQIGAAPHLAGIQMRVLAEDCDHRLMILEHSVMGSEPAVVKGSLPLEHWGTRDAPRSHIWGLLIGSVNGYHCQLVDLSHSGAQLVVSSCLRPSQQVRVTLSDGPTTLRCRAVVAWSKAEPGLAAVQYRVGVMFTDPDIEAIDALCAKSSSRTNVSQQTKV